MLDKYRIEIDQIDNQILNLLDERFELTKQVGEYKKENNIEVLNSNREQIIINKIKELNLKHEDEVINVYLSLMDISKDQQRG